MLGEFFDPKAELFVNERLKPHWSQAGAIVFVTFRTIDSIPQSTLKRWEAEKQEWVRRAMERRGSLREPQEREHAHWSKLLPLLVHDERTKFHRHFNRCRETELDECRGACILKQPEAARIVADALHHFDGDRYRLGDYVVMPNHVHLLVAFGSPETMEKQFDSWLHYTAVRLNRLIGSSGRFWQQEPFDHLVRSLEQYEQLRDYIAKNPEKAGLKPGEFLYREYGD